MGYFKPSFSKFLKELAKTNTTEWFNENRKTYESEVKKPFAALVEELIHRIQKHEPEVKIKSADAIMRINKDIRFSKDKTPYNTHVSAIISVTGKKDKSYPGLYFQLSPEGIEIYGGAYVIETPTLQTMRTYIDSHLKDFSAAYNHKEFKAKFGTLHGEQHKRIPPEFQSAFEKEPLMANKQFYFKATLKPGMITSEDLPDVIMAYYLAGKPVNDFLKKAMKR